MTFAPPCIRNSSGPRDFRELDIQLILKAYISRLLLEAYVSSTMEKSNCDRVFQINPYNFKISAKESISRELNKKTVMKYY